MPGPRVKRNSAKKTKRKVASRDDAASRSALSSAISSSVPTTLDGLPNDGWDKVAEVLCEHFQLPNLATGSGLKKVYHNFACIYKQMNDTYVAYDANEVIRGGIIAIYVKMCVDSSILRNMLFHQEGLLEKIVALGNKPNTRHLALRALTTITQHGGSDIRKEISEHIPVMIKLLQDSPEDLYAAELIISTIAHAVTYSFDEPDKPAISGMLLRLSKLLPLVLSFFGKPGVSLPLLHHALELFGQLTRHRAQNCLQFPNMTDFLVACLRSADMHSRFYALGAVFRLHPSPLKKIVRFWDPSRVIPQNLPEHIYKLLVDYGLSRCECTLTRQSCTDYKNAILQCDSYHDLYKLGLALAELVPRSEGSILVWDQHMKNLGHVDVGLPFKTWADALPICAQVVRERGEAGEQDLADMLDMKFLIHHSQVPEALAIAKRGIERNPKFAYAYYIMTLGSDDETGLRWAKKGLKCKNTTPFVNLVLRARATEFAGNLAVCCMQASTIGDRKWEQGQAFMSSALDDARIFLSQAPPDMCYRKSILYWHMILTLVEKGPKLSTGMREFKKHREAISIADEFYRASNTTEPKSQLRSVYQYISSRYPPASTKYGPVVARLNSNKVGAYVLSRDKAEDRLAVWLDDVQDEGEDDDAEDATATASSSRAGLPKSTEGGGQGLRRCSWCENPSAVLHGCGGCETARYCDASCQEMAWSEHRFECKSRG